MQIFDLKSEDIDPTRPLILDLLVLPNSEGKLEYHEHETRSILQLLTFALFHQRISQTYFGSSQS